MLRKLMDRVDRMMGRGVIDEEFYEELEEALLQADTNIGVAHEILEELRRRAGERGRPQQELDYYDRLLKEF